MSRYILSKNSNDSCTGISYLKVRPTLFINITPIEFYSNGNYLSYITNYNKFIVQMVEKYKGWNLILKDELLQRSQLWE